MASARAMRRDAKEWEAREFIKGLERDAKEKSAREFVKGLECKAEATCSPECRHLRACQAGPNVYSVYYLREEWSKPYETEAGGEPDGFLCSLDLADLPEWLEGLVPGHYELRRGDETVTIVVNDGSRKVSTSAKKGN